MTNRSTSSPPTPLTPPTPLDAAGLFNGYIGASLAFSFQRLGIFTTLKPGERKTLTELVAATGAIERRLRALLHAGATLGYLVEEPPDTFLWTEHGEELHKNKGYFTWSVGGYGRFLRELSTLAKSDMRWDHLRDGSLVALGADQSNASLMRDTLFSVLDRVRFSRIADLGCGNAGRLVDFCHRYPGVTGVGIDINADAITLARQHVKTNGLEGSIELHCQNVLRSFSDEAVKRSLRDVEVVTCFLMLHDLLNVESLKDELFDHLRSAFPNASTFIIADTARMPRRDELEEMPIFNVGFELVHAFMDITIFDKSVYFDMFERAGLHVEACVDFGTPYTYLFQLRV